MLVLLVTTILVTTTLVITTLVVAPLLVGRTRRSVRLRLAGPAARGQATAEYALVLLGVATVALLLAAWAARSGKIGQLFDAVVDQLISKVG